MANLARGHASRKTSWPGATRRDRIGKLKRRQTPVAYGAVLIDARSVLRLATMTMLGGRRGRPRRFWTQHDPAIVAGRTGHHASARRRFQDRSGPPAIMGARIRRRLKKTSRSKHGPETEPKPTASQTSQ